MMPSVTNLRHLIALANGESVPGSKLRGTMFERLKEEKLLVAITHGSRKSFQAVNCESLRFHLNDIYGLRDLEKCLYLAESDHTSRAEMVHATGNSKLRPSRSFKGFMVNCLQQIEGNLNGQTFNLQPLHGTFTFIYDYESFRISEDVIIVGIENPENFRWISKQAKFFKENVSDSSPILFVCRYPQDQHCDLIKWLKSIPNRYIHFGDLDLAGIKIYLTEFFCHLGERSSFLVPSDFDERIASGSPDRYNNQMQFASIANSDPRLRLLIDSIQHHHRGYDQEGFIEEID